MNRQDKSSPVIAGFIGGLIGAVVAVILVDDTKRKKAMSLVRDFKDRAVDSLDEVAPDAVKKVKKSLGVGK